MVVIFVIFPL